MCTFIIGSIATNLLSILSYSLRRTKTLKDKSQRYVCLFKEEYNPSEAPTQVTTFYVVGSKEIGDKIGSDAYERRPGLRPWGLND